jgi:hypothetical protein
MISREAEDAAIYLSFKFGKRAARSIARYNAQHDAIERSSFWFAVEAVLKAEI